MSNQRYFPKKSDYRRDENRGGWSNNGNGVPSHGGYNYGGQGPRWSNHGGQDLRSQNHGGQGQRKHSGDRREQNRRGQDHRGSNNWVADRRVLHQSDRSSSRRRDREVKPEVNRRDNKNANRGQDLKVPMLLPPPPPPQDPRVRQQAPLQDPRVRPPPPPQGPRVRQPPPSMEYWKSRHSDKDMGLALRREVQDGPGATKERLEALERRKWKEQEKEDEEEEREKERKMMENLMPQLLHRQPVLQHYLQLCSVSNTAQPSPAPAFSPPPTRQPSPAHVQDEDDDEEVALVVPPQAPAPAPVPQARAPSPPAYVAPQVLAAEPRPVRQRMPSSRFRNFAVPQARALPRVPVAAQVAVQAPSPVRQHKGPGRPRKDVAPAAPRRARGRSRNVVAPVAPPPPAPTSRERQPDSYSSRGRPCYLHEVQEPPMSPTKAQSDVKKAEEKEKKLRFKASRKMEIEAKKASKIKKD